jgi:MFS family permease
LRKENLLGFQTQGFAKHEAPAALAVFAHNWMLNTFLSSAGTRPRWLSQRSSRSYTIFVVSYAVFVDIFLYGVIVPVIPFALKQRVGIPFQHVQHWVSILLAVYGGSLLFFSVVAGYWADKMDTRRWPFMIGLLLLAGSTIMPCLATSIVVMLIARILQGASAAVVWTVAITVMTDRIGTKELGQAMGYVTLARSVAIVIGPLLGGVVYARAGYYAVYAMVFAFLFFDIVFRLVLIEARVARKWDPSIAPLDGEVEMRAIENSKPEANMTSTVVMDTASCSPHDQKRGRMSNLLPSTITIFANPRVAIALWGCFWQASLLCGCDAVVPIFVKRTFGWNSFGAGLIFLAVVIPGFVSPVIGYLSDKHGPKWLSVFGYLACAPPLILLRLVDHDSTQQKVLFAALLALLGAFCMFFEVSSPLRPSASFSAWLTFTRFRCGLR